MAYEVNCPFCNPLKDSEQNIIFENETCYFLQHNLEQDVLEGCGVIVPKKHRINTFELTKEEWNDTYELLQSAKVYLNEKFSPDGYTLGWNVGKYQTKLFFIVIFISFQDMMMSHWQAKVFVIGLSSLKI